MEESGPHPPSPSGGSTDAPSGAALERAANYTAAIYGSILVAALVSTLDAEHAHASAMVVAVLTTTVVFWLAHVWADVVGEQMEMGWGLGAARWRTLARRQWPMIEAAAAPVVPLVLAWVELISLDLAVWLALALSVVQLTGWGIVVGLRSTTTWPLAIAAGLVNGVLGLTIVLLKSLVH